MSDIPSATLARFQGATTLCQCWKLVSRDAALTIRATDHDRDLTFRGERYVPGLTSGSASLRHTLGLAPEPLGSTISYC